MKWNRKIDVRAARNRAYLILWLYLAFCFERFKHEPDFSFNHSRAQ